MNDRTTRTAYIGGYAGTDTPAKGITHARIDPAGQRWEVVGTTTDVPNPFHLARSPKGDCLRREQRRRRRRPRAADRARRCADPDRRAADRGRRHRAHRGRPVRPVPAGGQPRLGQRRRARHRRRRPDRPGPQSRGPHRLRAQHLRAGGPAPARGRLRPARRARARTGQGHRLDLGAPLRRRRADGRRAGPGSRGQRPATARPAPRRPARVRGRGAHLDDHDPVPGRGDRRPVGAGQRVDAARPTSRCGTRRRPRGSRPTAPRSTPATVVTRASRSSPSRTAAARFAWWRHPGSPRRRGSRPCRGTSSSTPSTTSDDEPGESDVIHVANQLAGTVMTFRVDATAGTITPVGQAVTAPVPACIALL